MTVFRETSSFAFLKIAREAGVPYAKELHIGDVIDGGTIPAGPTANDPLVGQIVEAVHFERARRIGARKQGEPSCSKETP